MKEERLKIQAEEVRTCFLCGNFGIPLYSELQDSLFGTSGNWSFFRCPHCNLVWLNPRLSLQEIRTHYSTYYNYTQTDMPRGCWVFLKNLAKRSVLAVGFGYRGKSIKAIELMIGRFLSWFSPLREIIGGRVMWLKIPEGRKRLLDIGCGTGGFLAQLRDFGWEVEGVELNPRGVRIAQQNYGLTKVYQGILKEVCFPNEYFDVITMSHLIEHLPDPIETLRECFRILKTGGKIVIVTPNIESLAHKFFGRHWLGLVPPWHLYVFSRQALKDCILQAGLKIENIQTLACNALGIWQLSHLIKRNNNNNLTKQGGIFYKISDSLSLSSYVSGFMFYILEYFTNKKFSSGEEILLVARK